MNRQSKVDKIVKRFMTDPVYDVRQNQAQYLDDRVRYKKYHLDNPPPAKKKIEVESTYEKRFRYLNIDSKHRDTTLYPDANHYVVKFAENHFDNVIEVELVGSTFYNVHRAITSENNTICWSTTDAFSGDTIIYEASIDVGNYKFEDILVAIQDAMNAVVRINGVNHCFVVDGDDANFTASITGYNQFTTSNCLSITLASNQLNITYPLHGLNINDTIIIENAPDVGGIPAIYINKEHVITGVPGVNTITVTLDVSATSTEGPIGTDVILKTLYPSNFYFSSYPLGSVLGFGTADTGYQEVHMNDPDSVTLLDKEYFLMCSPEICGDFSGVEEHHVLIFAKIQNAARYGDIMFNSYVGGRKIFYNHEIDRLEQIELRFQYEDGTLVDFDKKEHSFVLKITQLVKKSPDMHYNSKLGTFYNYNQSDSIKEFSSDFRVGIRD